MYLSLLDEGNPVVSGVQDSSKIRWPSSVSLSERLEAHSTLGIGGAADVFAEPASEAEVSELVARANEIGIPYIFIGGGSNLLFDDRGYRGLVIKLGGAFASRHREGNGIVSQAGAWVPGIARFSQQCGLSGIEHVVGIPGTIGGLVAINGGSLRQGIGSHVRDVTCIDRNGGLVSLAGEDCAFSYRHSRIREMGLTVLSVRLAFLKEDDPVAIRRRMLEILRSRRRKFPLKRANCGSVFLSTPENFKRAGPPGQIIEECNLKGLRIGDAVVSQDHANFFVNVGKASSRDFRRLIDEVYRTVYRKLGIRLRCEVQYVSENGQISAYDPLGDRAAHD